MSMPRKLLLISCQMLLLALFKLSYFDCAGPQAVGHLQTATPPILPPICQLFGVARDAPPELRPLHSQREPDASLLQVLTCSVASTSSVPANVLKCLGSCLHQLQRRDPPWLLLPFLSCCLAACYLVVYRRHWATDAAPLTPIVPSCNCSTCGTCHQPHMPHCLLQSSIVIATDARRRAPSGWRGSSRRRALAAATARRRRSCWRASSRRPPLSWRPGRPAPGATGTLL